MWLQSTENVRGLGPRALAVAGVATGMLVLVGCSQPTVNTAGPKASRSTPDFIEGRRVRTDDDLAEVAGVVNIAEGSVGDRMKVQAELRNITDDYARVRYRFEWFDPKGLLIREPNVTWRNTGLQGGETKWISDVAPNAAAADFRLKLLRAE